jgi:hypothetical protein
MPDTLTIFEYIGAVFTGPVQAVGAFVVALFSILFLLYLLKEQIDNARNR